MLEDNLQYLKQYKDILCCPKCTGNLNYDNGIIECLDCHQHFQISDNIPLLFWPDQLNSSQEKVTHKLKIFYEDNPFPGYEDFDDIGSLIQYAKEGRFARLLDEQIPFGANIFEAGCGTGQLSNFLSIANRTVFATDMSFNSLKLGQDFKERNKLDRVNFLQMNLWILLTFFSSP